MYGYINAGAGIYCELFSWDNIQPPLMEKLKPYALHCLLNLHQKKFERAFIFSDSKAAILSAGSTETVI